MSYTNKIVVRREVKFLETENWNWDESCHQYFEEDIDDFPVRGTKILFYIYQKCNVIVFEPTSYA